MLRLSDDLRFKTQVEIRLKGLTADFGIECRLLDYEKLQELQDRQRRGALTEAEFTDLQALEGATERSALEDGRMRDLQVRLAQSRLTPESFVREWLTGWDDQVQDSQGAPLAFTNFNVQRLLAVPGVSVAMVRAFYRGYEEATEGNSEPLPAGS